MIKIATASELPIVEGIMGRILREDPSYWPHGLKTNQFNGGLYLVKESATADPVGFVGWQKFDEGEKKVGYYAVGILPAYRERGFAKSAVAQVIREVRDRCDDVKAMIMRHNSPSKALARSLNIEVVEKCANTKAVALKTLVGALGTTAFFDQAADPQRTIGSTFQPWQWDKQRSLMGGLNALFGAIGGHQIASKNVLTGLGAIALAPTKDLAMKGIGTLHNVDNAAIEAAKSFAHDRAQPPAENPIKSIPKEVWLGAGGLGLGALGLLLYKAKKNNDMEQKRLALDSAGTASVTLPTANPGDIETQIQMPVGNLQLSNTLLQRLGRDTRRRLRTETRARTKHRNEKQPQPVEKSAASLVGLVAELTKYALGPAPAGAVPVPPQLGQNPALRMQNQQQATANSITPPPAANPAVMQAEQKAMQAEQAAAQQQGQAQQAATQAQMEMEQRFQQELGKQQQEKEVLQLQLEKAKATADLHKEQAKATIAMHKEQAKMTTAMGKAQSDGAASASDSENTMAGRLIGNRIDRLQRRVGHIKSAVQGSREGNAYGVRRRTVDGMPMPEDYSSTVPASNLGSPAEQLRAAGRTSGTFEGGQLQGPGVIPNEQARMAQQARAAMGDSGVASTAAGLPPPMPGSPAQMQVNGRSYTTGVPTPAPFHAPPAELHGPPAPGRVFVNGTEDYTTGTAPGSGRNSPKPFRHLAPESGQMLNNHPGANALFPRLGLYRASYGALGDTMFDWLLKKRLTTPKPPPRLVSEADIVNSPDRMGMMFDNITTDPRLTAGGG